MEAGQVLGDRFEIVRSLGHGAMAEVFLVRDLRLGGEAAIKLIHPQYASDPETLERFRLELEISRKARHPGILELREFHQDGEGRAWISMEYLPGGDLRGRILREGSLPPAEVGRIGREALAALAAAHAAGVVHRDLKPHNLLFAADGSVRIADFGLARLAASDQDQAEVAAGTPDYCAPELAEGLYADGRADLYSLGATLFEAATGRTPFLAESPWQAMRLRATTRAPRASSLVPGIPPWLDGALARALEADPADRFQSAREFSRALSPAASDEARKGGGKPTAGSRPSSLLRCPSCGAPLPESLPWCWDCGKAAVVFEKAGRSEAAWRLVVMGSGKPGDKLLPEEREACLRCAGEADASRLRQRLPRIPFILGEGLSRASAESAAAALRAEGVQALAVGRGAPAERVAEVRAAGRKRIWTITPRIWLIILAGAGSAFQGLFRGLAQSGASALPIAGLILASALLAPLVAVAVSGSRSLLRLSRGRAGGSASSLARVAPLLRDGELRDLARSAALRLDALDERLRAGRGGISPIEREDVAALSACLAESAAVLAPLLEGAQRDIDLLGRPGTTASERRIAQSELDAKRADILSCSAALDGALVALSGTELSETGKRLSGLRAELSDLGDRAAAWKELER